jgi:uncharacterized metal-binding protein
MASGKVHSAATTGAAIGIGFSVVASSVIELDAWLIGGVLLGSLVSPDQDVDDGNISYYFMRKVWLEWWWSAIWRPYAVLFSHRGFSHFPVISSVIRLTYFVFPVILLPTSILKNQRLLPRLVLAQIASVPIGLLFFFIYTHHPTAIVSIAVGLIFSDIIHLLFDI